MRELLATLEIRRLEIRPLATRTDGDVVLVHYLITAELEGADGAHREVGYRITHTWVRESGAWKILGGMSADAPKGQ
jgi:ketosteroid isomerase-like protein